MLNGYCEELPVNREMTNRVNSLIFSFINNLIIKRDLREIKSYMDNYYLFFSKMLLNL
jgi:hypothetical protein